MFIIYPYKLETMQINGAVGSKAWTALTDGFDMIVSCLVGRASNSVDWQHIDNLSGALELVKPVEVWQRSELFDGLDPKKLEWYCLDMLFGGPEPVRLWIVWWYPKQLGGPDTINSVE